MTIVRKSLSTESFDKRLGNRQRFMQFSELFEHFSNTGGFDPAEDAPFKASMNSIAVGTTLLGRCRGTFRTVRREKRQVLATNDDRYCFARNAEAHDAYVVHRGKEFRLRPGSMAILKLDGTFSAADGTSYKRFTNVHLPSGALQAMVANVDDMVGVEFAPGGALTLAMDYSDLVLANDRVADEAGTQIASHILDLVAIGLGARRDAGEMAGKRGLRAVRLTHVLNILQRRFTEADFPRMHWRRRRACPSATSTNCCMRRAQVSARDCWNCDCGRPSICWRSRAIAASATSPSPAASTTCPISTAASAAASG